MTKPTAVTLNSAISSLIANKRRVSALKALGILTVGDALTYYPFRVTNPVPICSIAQLVVGAPSALPARVEQVHLVSLGARRGFRLDVAIDDSQYATQDAMAGRTARLVFFSHRKSYMDWMQMRLQVGTQIVLAGEPSVFNGQLQFTHPEVLVVRQTIDSEFNNVLPQSVRADSDSIQEALAKVSRPRPVYHASSRISSEHIHDTIVDLMRLLADQKVQAPAADDMLGQGYSEEKTEEPPLDISALSQAVPDVLPENVRVQNSLMHRAQAFTAIHNPERVKDFQDAIATMRFEEAFVSQIALLRSRNEAQNIESYVCPKAGPNSLTQDFINSLPFELTSGQEEVIAQIQEDMGRDYPMQRLLQGEVGSGKTVVALTAMLQAVDAGYQAVLVAPTQVLAEQHYQSIQRMLSALNQSAPKNKEDDVATPVPLVLLTGGMKLSERRKALAVSASGQPCIVIATHAAFSKTFQAPNLAIAVIDEQHRFGVEQREALRRKSEKAPHLLVMTATPIPRTAAMTWFGDLNISMLTQLPGGRKPVKTYVIAEPDSGSMANMFLLMRQRIQAGERAYVVCPRISENEAEGQSTSGESSSQQSSRKQGHSVRDEDEQLALDPYANQDSEDIQGQQPLHSVEEILRRLSSLPQLQGINIASLTGKDEEEHKTKVMTEFASGKTPILVATTVIEVGVDVPEASIIVIFDADRFGLSQLHQLRGRVGRGGTDSWAFLISRAEPDSLAAQRLEVIRTSRDGSQIAEADIELRGAGDVLGGAQSGGQTSLKLLRVVSDADIITQARQQAQTLLNADPELTDQVQLAGAALDFMRGKETFLTST